MFVEVPGVLDEAFVKPGDRVEAGQPLAPLSNIDVRIEVDKLVGRRDETRKTSAACRKNDSKIRRPMRTWRWPSNRWRPMNDCWRSADVT
ncbi:MAG: hypothetical protein QM775_30415 [Pirellulales bacterium]